MINLNPLATGQQASSTPGLFDRSHPFFAPENMLMLGGSIMAAPNLAEGLGTGLQHVGRNMAQQRVTNKTRQWLQKQFPGEDFSTMSPDMMKLYAEQAFKNRFSPKNDYQFLQAGDRVLLGDKNSGTLKELGHYPKTDTPAIADEFQYARAQGFKGSFQDYQTYKAGLNKSGFMVEQTNDGLRVVQGDLTSAPSKITESQSKDINWLTRGKGANDELSQLDAKLTSLSEDTAAKLGTPGNYLKTEDYQMAERAGREFLAVVLRKDSGGAITPDEYASYAPTFLPQPGDGPQVIQRKRMARERFLEAMNSGLPSNMQNLVPKNDPSVTGQMPDQSTTQPKTITLPDGTQGTIRRTK